jgi:hypothetical protein
MRAKIKSEAIEVVAEIWDNEMGKRIYDALPIKGVANKWGEEIFFFIPLYLRELEGARVDVEPEEIGYWPPGNAFCIFLGRTPISTSDKPRAASPVNVFGEVKGDLSPLKRIKRGHVIEVERA